MAVETFYDDADLSIIRDAKLQSSDTVPRDTHTP